MAGMALQEGSGGLGDSWGDALSAGQGRGVTGCGSEAPGEGRAVRMLRGTGWPRSGYEPALRGVRGVVGEEQPQAGCDSAGTCCWAVGVRTRWPGVSIEAVGPFWVSTPGL